MALKRCKVCDREIDKKTGRKFFCSKECKHTNTIHQQRIKRNSFEIKYIDCIDCSETIVKKSGNHERCSDCSKKRHQRRFAEKQKENRQKFSSYENQRRKRKYKEDPIYRAKICEAAYSRKRKLTGADGQTIRFIALLQQAPCSYCNKEGGTVDHVIPITRGGAHHWSNMVSCCVSCNASKGNKIISEWLKFDRRYND